MAKLPYTPLQLAEEVIETTVRNGLVVMNLLSNGVVMSIALSPRSAMFLHNDLRRAAVDAIDQRHTDNVVAFARSA